MGIALGLALGVGLCFAGSAAAQPAPGPAAAPGQKPAKKDKPSTPKDGGRPKSAFDEGPSGKAASKEAKDTKEEAPEVKAARGVVTITRAGIPVGLGAVLGGDGRILTALSPLGSGNDLDARFADGSTSKLKLGHHDRAWDLALLIPQSGKWTEGLTASGTDPLREDADIHTFSTTTKATPSPMPIELTSKRAIIGGDDQTLDDALELGSRINPMNLGAPIVDETGKVVGIIGRGCMPIADNKPCVPVAFGVPVHAIKSFLKTVPESATQPAPFLGIQGAKEVGAVAKGVRVLSVAKGSPAAAAKLKGGEKSESDMILAVGGDPVTTPDELATAIKKHAIGEKIPLTVFGKNAYRQVEVTLASPPDARNASALLPAKKQPAAKDAMPPKEPKEAKRPKADKAPAPAPRDDGDDPFSTPM